MARRSVRGVGLRLARWLPLLWFRGSESYWKARYRLGGDSGSGSSGPEAAYKAQVVNEFVRRHGVRSVIEFGCGDGQQLALATYDTYLGIDVSTDAVETCRRTFRDDPGKGFSTEYRGERADLALSLDVLYHLVEDTIYDAYLERLFGAAERFVVIYSTDGEGRTARHVRHRPVARDVHERFPAFALMEGSVGIPPGAARFFMYERSTATR